MFGNFDKLPILSDFGIAHFRVVGNLEVTSLSLVVGGRNKSSASTIGPEIRLTSPAYFSSCIQSHKVYVNRKWCIEASRGTLILRRLDGH